MATPLFVGDVVMFKPTRATFAITSGSWTGNPANKKRPCVVVDFDSTNLPIVTPLCGARYIYAVGWIRRAGMNVNWWHPVYFANTNVFIPQDGAAVRRQPITLIHDPYARKPSSVNFEFKPSYIWVGDRGELVSPNVVQSLIPLNNYLRMGAQQRAMLEQWWDYWSVTPG